MTSLLSSILLDNKNHQPKPKVQTCLKPPFFQPFSSRSTGFRMPSASLKPTANMCLFSYIWIFQNGSRTWGTSTPRLQNLYNCSPSNINTILDDFEVPSPETNQIWSALGHRFHPKLVPLWYSSVGAVEPWDMTNSSSDPQKIWFYEHIMNDSTIYGGLSADYRLPHNPMIHSRLFQHMSIEIEQSEATCIRVRVCVYQYNHIYICVCTHYVCNPRTSPANAHELAINLH